MEFDQSGKITRFEVGDKFVFEDGTCVVDGSAAYNLNHFLNEARRGDISLQELSEGFSSLITLAPLNIIRTSPLKIFKQLPVDLSKVRQ